MLRRRPDQGVDDIGFIRDVIDVTGARLRVDPQRVYVSSDLSATDAIWDFFVAHPRP